jgi:2-aminoethylphosphonate dioxygenase
LSAILAQFGVSGNRFVQKERKEKRGKREREMETFTEEQLNQFKRDGYVFVSREQMWKNEELKSLLDAVNDMDSWPDTPGMIGLRPLGHFHSFAGMADSSLSAGKWMKYYEKSLRHPDAPKILQRIENFLEYNESLNKICNGQRMMNLVSQLFGETAVLYKEKINYKLPGGDGFKPHQDVAAGIVVDTMAHFCHTLAHSSVCSAE